MPGGFPSTAQQYRALGATTAGVQQQIELSKLFNNDVYNEKQTKAVPTQTYSLTYTNSKKWKDAIVVFSKYRDQFPKGKKYADATYKIGVCFQELGMKEEAKPFLEEVVAKFPGTSEAKKASFRLKAPK